MPPGPGKAGSLAGPLVPGPGRSVVAPAVCVAFTPADL